MDSKHSNWKTAYARAVAEFWRITAQFEAFGDLLAQWRGWPWIIRLLAGDCRKTPWQVTTEVVLAAALAVNFLFSITPLLETKPWGDDKCRQSCTFLLPGDPAKVESLDVTHRARLAAPMVAGWFCNTVIRPLPGTDLYHQDHISLGRLMYNRLTVVIACFHALWLALLLWLIMRHRPDAVIIMLGTYAGLGYSLIQQTGNIYFPWDMSAMFFFTLAMLLFDQRRWGALLATVWLGALFKETLLCCGLLVLFHERWNWRRRLGSLAAVGLAALLTRKLLMSLYGIHTLTVPLNNAQSWSEIFFNTVLFKNLDDLFSLNLNHVAFANGGALLLMLLIPWRNRRDLARKSVVLAFVAGEFFCGVIDEFRIWYELLPLGWMMVSESLGFAHPRAERPLASEPEPAASQPAAAPPRGPIWPCTYWWAMGFGLAVALGLFLVNQARPFENRMLGQGALSTNLNQLILLADQGSMPAINRLATMYSKGEGVPQDRAEAIKWLRVGAERNDSVTQCRLAAAFYYGRGTPTNRVQAAYWWGRAARTGNGNAEYSLGLMYQTGEGGLPQDPHLAFECFAKAARKGDLSSCAQLAAIYQGGLGTDRNVPEALRWARKAAEAKYPLGQRVLGLMLFNGEGVDPNPEAAISLWREAAENGDLISCWNLVTTFSTKGNSRHNPPEALKWLLKAARLGDASAMQNAATVYLDPANVIPKDPVAAWAWLELAANRASAEAATQRDELTRRLSPADLAKAQAMAKELAKQISN